MSEKVTVRWTVEDGYVGKSRPQETEIDVETLLSDYDPETDHDIHYAVYEAVDEDFQNRVSYGITNLDEVVEAVRQAAERRAAEED